VNIQRIKSLIDVVAQEDIAEMSIVEGSVEIRILQRLGPGMRAQAESERATIEYGPVPIHELRPSDSTGATSSINATAHPGARKEVLSPMVGTFYRGAKSGSEPLVQVGSEVQAGTPLCVIEAMKLMHEVSADRAGRVTKVLCKDGQVVELDQPLFVIE
jgi:acetyl-CoA carboxylase biotin carboxyl carrier protein